MRKTREEKAITLIALIITIVVLLILAVVAINAVTGDGIIQHAVNAKEDYEQAQDEEQDVLAYYEQYLETEGKAGNWIQDKTTVKNVKTGQELEVGKTVTNYNANGYTWKVLGAENGYLLLTTNESIPKVTLQGSTAGWNAAENRFVGAENSLHNACKGIITDLGPATSVRNIKVEDINRVTGYNPLKQKDGTIYGDGEGSTVCAYGSKVTYTAEKDDNGKVTGMIGSYVTTKGEEKNVTITVDWFINPDGRCIVKDDDLENITDATGLESKDTIEIEANCYSYLGSEYLTDKDDVHDFLFNSGTYFLASSTVVIFSYNGRVLFSMRVVDEQGRVYRTTLWHSIEEGKVKEGNVRPVVYMPSDYKPVVE